MIEIIVRSHRDAKAVEAMLTRFYSDWDIVVRTLKGSRTFNKAMNVIEGFLTRDKFYIFLLGKEDQELARELMINLPLNTVIHIVPATRVRNLRLEHLAYEFDRARSYLRLAASWNTRYNVFVFGLRMGIMLKDYDYNPAYDSFLGIGEGFHRVLEDILGGRICRNPLLVRKLGGIHDIYCGIEKSAVLKIPDEGFKPSGTILGESIGDIDLDAMVKANEEVLGVYEGVSVRFLEKYREWADTVVVPWSGGKDSTVTLILALRVFPRRKIRVLYIDTGTEFPWTIKYVEEISRRLGIKPIHLYAGVDRGLLVEGMPMPTHDNRWCTGRKIGTLEKAIMEVSDGNVLVVTGDRDAESKRRSIRAPVRSSGEYRIISPIKPWGATHTQLYLLWKGIPLNPLYLHGFYRIGCYICPALRSWELYIMTRDQELRSILEKYPLYRLFLEHRRRTATSSSE